MIFSDRIKNKKIKGNNNKINYINKSANNYLDSYRKSIK